jgi:hypothetical protein
MSERSRQRFIYSRLYLRDSRVRKPLGDSLRVEGVEFIDPSLQTYDVLPLLLDSVEGAFWDRRGWAARGHDNPFLTI